MNYYELTVPRADNPAQDDSLVYSAPCGLHALLSAEARCVEVREVTLIQGFDPWTGARHGIHAFCADCALSVMTFPEADCETPHAHVGSYIV